MHYKIGESSNHKLDTSHVDSIKKFIPKEITEANNKAGKWMGCLPSSAFFYVIELDASTTVKVANMIQRTNHPSSSFCWVRTP
jgi:hypothetical protein